MAATGSVRDTAHAAGPLEEETIQIHATCVEVAGVGVLLRGPAGAGKSDLALRLVDGGARLVADDRVDLTAVERDGGSHLLAAAPARLAGLIEVRGVGILRVPTLPRATLGLVVDLVRPDRVERLPERARCDYLGVALPLLALTPFEASAAAKLRLAARAVAADISFDDEG